MCDDFHALSSVQLTYIPIVPQCKVCLMFVVCPRGDLMKLACRFLTFKRRIKSHLPFAGIIRSSPYSPRFQDNG